MKVSATLQQLVDDKLEASGLRKHLKAHGMEAVDSARMADMGFAPRGGIFIPYFDFDGEVTQFFRVRFLEDPPPNGWNATPIKPQRYAQPAGSVNEIYLSPLVPWNELKDDVSVPLVITEGEFKAACACSHDIAAIGLGGVWNFRAAKMGLPFLTQLERIKWRGRQVYVCFDSDAAEKPNVMAAEASLASELLRRGADARIVRLPADGDDKVGLDDWLMNCAKPKEEFEALLESARPIDAKTAALHRMNSEFVLISKPPCVMNLKTRDSYKYADFVNIVCADRAVEITETDTKGNRKVKVVDTAREWVKWAGHTKADGVIYAPGESEMVDGKFNLWQGWRYEPRKGDVQPFLDLLRYIFKGDAEAQRWFLQWLAYPVQHPGVKLFSACVLWGAQGGTGKSLLGEILDMLYQPHGVIINEERLDGRFNAWQEGVSFCVGEEITGNDSRLFANKLKDMVTRQHVYVEHKGIDAMRLVDCTNYLLFSNHPDAVKLDVQDRRYFVWETPSEKLATKEGTRISRAMKSPEGMSALMHYLLEVDTSDFEPRAAPPVTHSKQAMIRDGMSDVELWIQRVLHENALQVPLELATADDMMRLYEPDDTRRKIRPVGMSRALRTAGLHQVNNSMVVKLTDGRQVHIFAIAPDPMRRMELLKMPGPKLRAIYENERKTKVKR